VSITIRLRLTTGSILLSRVSRFVRLLRRPDAPIKDRQSPDFIVIDKDLSDFKYVRGLSSTECSRTFPASLRDPLQPCPGYSNRIDTDLIVSHREDCAQAKNAHLMHRVAAIMLHEPFAELSDPTCPSASRILVEAKSCLGVLYLIMSTTSDMALMLYPVTSGRHAYLTRTHDSVVVSCRENTRSVLSPLP
jgi:hypothetical protein